MSKAASRIVVVESPAKVDTIGKYLGEGWKVVSSYGHVRDLLPKDGSVKPDENFALTWYSDKRGEERIRAISRLLEVAGRDAELWLATDPDREGEAISWHLAEELERRQGGNLKAVRRVTFNEITKQAVERAFAQPRELDQSLIDAYLARRALDYLFGFTLSPVLWRKLPGSRSAGRVQSVALRLVCEREAEIEAFVPVPYWSVEVLLEHEGQAFIARPALWNGAKVPARGFDEVEHAQSAAAELRGASVFTVSEIEAKTERRRPKAPFITSTLQQEASNRLGMTATQTMRVAQGLYEAGLITYMRTDGVNMAQSAVMSVRETIGGEFGNDFLSEKPRMYKSRSKNAQEAHEAIRPTDPALPVNALRASLDKYQVALYSLIRSRALASQMADAVLDKVQAVILADGFNGELRASGTSIRFPGYLSAWKENIGDEPRAQRRDGESESEGEGEGDSQAKAGILPPLKAGDKPDVRADQPIGETRHETKPPGRFSEASLVKRLEELGIGRPSTYASTLQVLRDRNYVEMQGRSFTPCERGRVVVAFLEEFFSDYVEYDFTAKLEDDLDEIAGGKLNWKDALGHFWSGFSTATEGLADLKISDVIDVLDAKLGPHFFPQDKDNPEKDPRECPTCKGRLGIKLGKTGGFIGCGNYPECRHTRPLDVSGEGNAEPRELGEHPVSGLAVSLRTGPYGPYVQEGETPPKPPRAKKGEKRDLPPKPKRASLSPGEDPEGLTLERALGLLSLPREIGEHEGEAVTAGLGRYGPWVRLGKTYASIPKDEDVLEVGLNRAVALVDEKKKKQSGGSAGALRTLGEHTESGGVITVHDGRYGAYVKLGKINATIPRDLEADTITTEQAQALIDARAAKAAAPKRKTKTKVKAKAKAKRKTVAKKTAAKP